MTERLVINIDNQILTDTITISDFTGIEHTDILEVITTIPSYYQLIQDKKIRATTYCGRGIKRHPKFLLDKDSTILLIEKYGKNYDKYKTSFSKQFDKLQKMNKNNNVRFSTTEIATETGSYINRLENLIQNEINKNITYKTG